MEKLINDINNLAYLALTLAYLFVGYKFHQSIKKSGDSGGLKHALATFFGCTGLIIIPVTIFQSLGVNNFQVFITLAILVAISPLVRRLL